MLANCESIDEEVASYIPDDEQGQYAAVQALLAAGYRQPLCLHLPADHLATTRRRHGLERACREAGLDPDRLDHSYMAFGDEHYRDIPSVLQAHIQNGLPQFDSVIFRDANPLRQQGLVNHQCDTIVAADNRVELGKTILNVRLQN